MREEFVGAERADRENEIAKRDRRFFLVVLVGMWLQLVALVLLAKLAFCP
ncbi:MAG: hypothetical protein OXE53_05260 [Deltaproteobacteria bacterium]|nr:hypothetical protein [Deltaproteobacteria bacterium]